MDNLVFLAISVLAGAGAALICSGAVAFFFYKKMKEAREDDESIPNRVIAIEQWVNAQIKHQEMTERGRLGQQTRQDNAADMEAATEEGRAVLLGKGNMEEKKAALVTLIQKYPNVALRVAQRLNRQFGISKFIGVPEDEFLNMVVQLAAQAAAKPPEGGEAAQIAY